MTTIAPQITSLMCVYSTVYSDADQSNHQSSTSLAFVWGIHRDRTFPRTKGQLRQFPFDDVIMNVACCHDKLFCATLETGAQISWAPKITATPNDQQDIFIYLPFDCLRTSRRLISKWNINASLSLCERSQLMTGGFPSQRASNAERVSICWHHHATSSLNSMHNGLCSLQIIVSRNLQTELGRMS